MPYITEIYAREVLDNRGLPTIECEVYTESGAYGKSVIDSGEPFERDNELRDKEKKYFGLSVSKAVENVNRVLAKSLIGEDVRDQVKIDRKMISIDASGNKTKLGANAIFALSVAISKAAASYSKLSYHKYLAGPLSDTIPSPQVSLIELGDKSLVKEILISCGSMNSYKDAIRVISEFSYTLKDVIKDRGMQVSYSSGGSYMLEQLGEDSAFEMIKETSKKTGYKIGSDIFLSVVSNLPKLFKIENRNYMVNDKEITSMDAIEMYDSMYKKMGVISVTDPLSILDSDGLKKLTKKFGGKMQLLGDSILLSSQKMLDKAVKDGVLNGIVIRPSQIGTMSETFQLSEYARRSSYYFVITSDKGTGEDNYLSSLSVGLTSRMVRFGGLNSSSNISRYNELLRIEDDSKESYRFSQKNYK